jgi:hypothetical protein
MSSATYGRSAQDHGNPLPAPIGQRKSSSIRLLLSRGDRTLVMKIEHEPKGNTTCHLDSISLASSRRLPVMAANINILGAQIFTGNGVALDTLQGAASGELITNRKNGTGWKDPYPRSSRGR